MTILWIIRDGPAFDRPWPLLDRVSFNPCRQHLANGLQPAEKTCRFGGRQCHCLRVDVELVAFRAQVGQLLVQSEDQPFFGITPLHDLDLGFESSGRRNQIGEQGGHLSDLSPPLGHVDLGVSGPHKSVVSCGHADGLGNQAGRLQCLQRKLSESNHGQYGK